jgi:hypothetical protein
MDKCYKGMVNIPPQITDPCDGNPTSTNCVQSPISNPYLSLPAGATQTEINAALSSALIYKDTQIDTINNQTLKTVGGISLVGTGDIPLPSGGGGVIEVTYAELTSLIASSTLVVGQVYLLTDYMTTYTQPVTNTSMSSGVVEQLFLTAVDINKLHKIAKSKLYPQDIIYYEVTGDIGNAYFVGDSGTFTYGTEGFTKGKIYRRIDTLRNNDIGTDWRHVKYNREGEDYLLLESYNTSPAYDRTRNATIKTYNLMDTVISGVVVDSQIGSGFEKNSILGGILNSAIGDGFLNNSLASGLSNSTVGQNAKDNIIGINFSSNTVSNDFIGNTIGTAFSNNNVGVGFKNNIVGADFQYNNIGRGFEENTIDYGFQFNSIGDWFYSNTIGNNFYSNKIEDGFTSNNISDNIAYNRYTVNQLPIFLYQNQRFIVTDALNPIYLSVVVGGGTTLTSVMWNGVNNTWIVS